MSAGFELSSILTPGGRYAVEVDGNYIQDPHSYVVGPDDQLVTIIGRPGDPVSLFTGLAWFFSGLGLGATAATILAGAIVALPYIAVVASLVMVATMDIPKAPQSGPTQKLNSLTGSKNSFNPYGPLPIVYGTRRLFPALAAAPYTELQGKDQYLNMLFLVSIGECRVTLPKIGENLLDATYENVTLTSHYPAAPDWMAVSESYPGSELVDPQSAASPTWQDIETSGDNATYLGIDLVLPAGLMYTNSKGDRRAAKMHLRVEYREVGDTAWLNVRDVGWQVTTTGSGATSVLGNPAFGSNTGELWESDLYEAVKNSGGGTTATVSIVGAASGGRHLITLSTGFYNYNDDTGFSIRKTNGTFRPVTCSTTTRGYVTTWYISEADYSGFTLSGLTVNIYRDLRELGFMLWERNVNPFRIGLKWQPPAPGQYQVQVSRLWNQQDDGYTQVYVGTTGYGDTGATEYAKYQSALLFAVLRTYRAQQAVKLPSTRIPATYLALRIKANDQLNGTLDNLSVLVERKLRMWNGSSWDAAAFTRSPAAAALDMLINPAVNQKAIYDPADPFNPTTVAARALQDELIDLDSFSTWQSGVIATESFTYDEVIDYASSVFAAHRRASSVAWAGIVNTDGKFKVLEEKSGSVTRQIFTPKNSWDMQIQKTFVEPPHAVKVEFDSEEADNEQDQVIVYNDGYSATGSDHGNATGMTLTNAVIAQPNAASRTFFVTITSGAVLEGDVVRIGTDPTDYVVKTYYDPGPNPRTLTVYPSNRVNFAAGEAVVVQVRKAATKFESMRIPGLTVADNAYKHGRRLLATVKLRPEIYTFTAGLDSITVTRGDVAQFQYDAGYIGLGAARIVSKAGALPGAIRITLDEPVVTQTGKTYDLRCRRSNDPGGVVQIEIAQVTPYDTDNGINYTWTLPSSADDWLPGDLVVMGERNLDSRAVKILGITPGPNLTATITAVDESPGIYLAHEFPIPAYTPGITVPGDPSRATPLKPVILEVRAHPYMADIVDGGGKLYYASVSYRRGVNGSGLMVDKFSSLGALVRYRAVSDTGVSPALYGAWQSMYDPEAKGTFTIPVDNGQKYGFQVQLIPKNGAPASAFSDLYEYTVNVGILQLEVIDGLIVNGVVGGFEIDIDIANMTSSGVDYFEIIYGPDASLGSDFSHIVPAPSRLDGLINVTSFITTPTNLTNHYFWVRWWDIYGNFSPLLGPVGPYSSTAAGTGPEGPAGVVAALSVPVMVVAADNAGASFTLTNAGGTMTLREGGVLVASGITFSVVGGSGSPSTKVQNSLTMSINTTSGVYSLSGASWNTDLESFTLRAVYDGNTYDLQYTISKSKAGAQGDDGAPGPSGSATLAIRMNRQDLTATERLNALFLHGFDVDGIPVSAAGVLVWNGESRTVARGTLLASREMTRDGWILYDFGLDGLFTLNGSELNISNYNLALVRKLRGDIWEYNNDTGGGTNPGWTVFTPTTDMAIIGSYSKVGTGSASSGNGSISGAMLFGGGVSLGSIPYVDSHLVKPGDIDPLAINSVAQFASTIKPVQLVSGAMGTTGTWSGSEVVYNTTDNKLYRLVSNTPQVWTAAVAGADIVTGSIVAGKIAAAAVGADEIAAGAIKAGKLAVVSSGQTLNSNPAMDDLESWYTSADMATRCSLVPTKYSINPTTGNNGLTSFRVTSTADAQINAFASTRIPLDIRKVYRVSCYFKRQGAGTALTYPFVAFYSASNVLIPTSGSGATGWPGVGNFFYFATPAGSVPSNTVWTYAELTIGPSGSGATATYPTSPSAPRTIQLGAYASFDTGTLSITDFQDFRLEEVIPGVLIQDGAITADRLAVNAVTADKILANTITGSKIVAGTLSAEKLQIGPGNLLNDPSFEFSELGVISGSSSNWGVNAPTGASIINGGVSGPHCLALNRDATSPDASSTSAFSNAIPVTPGDKYRLTSVWSTTASIGVGGGVTTPLYVWKYDSGGNSAGQVAGIIPVTVPQSSSWQYAEYELLIPAGTYSIRVGAISYLTTGMLYVDDFSCVRKVDTVTIVDNAVTADKLEANLVLSSTIVAASPGNAVSGPRVILDDTSLPLWIGNSTKNTTNGKLYWDSTLNGGIGGLVVRGSLDASAITGSSIATSKFTSIAGSVTWIESAAGKQCAASAVIRGATFFGGPSTSGAWAYTGGSDLPIRHPDYGTANTGQSQRLQTVQQPLQVMIIYMNAARDPFNANTADIKLQHSYDGVNYTDSGLTDSLSDGVYGAMRCLLGTFKPKAGWVSSEPLYFRIGFRNQGGASDSTPSSLSGGYYIFLENLTGASLTATVLA